LAKQYADRGKKWWNKTLVDMRDPGFADFAGLNFNSDELRCAIGNANLNRLEDTNNKRKSIVSQLVDGINRMNGSIFRPYAFHHGFAPFYFPIFINLDQIGAPLEEVTAYISAAGFSIGVRYGCLVSTWNWAKPLLYDSFRSENALATRDSCFHAYINEKQDSRHVDLMLNILEDTSKRFKR
jgi:dTDP-4-amino-4,6-dideoxygalactose transaminase